MTQPCNPSSYHSTMGYPPSSSSDSSRPIKPEPIPLQLHHQNGSSSSSLSNGYRSNSASTASTANTSEHSPYGPCSPSSTTAQLPPVGSNGAAALLQQHQANQHAFRSTSAQHSFVFSNPSGPSTSSFNGRQGMDVTSRESSASSSRSDGGGGGPTQAESDYDPFRIKHRRRTSPPQLKILEYHFDLNPKPDVTVRKALSEQLEMTPREVQVWFQNRRAKVKKLKEKADRDGVSSSRSPKTEHSPPSSHSHVSPNLVPSVVSSELPVPPNSYPGSQVYPPRTVYGQEAISQRRTSPPASVYPMQQHYTGQPLPLSHPHSNDSLSHPAYAPPHHPSAYQSTVYTTTVASSTYATSNEYLPPPLPSNPSFALLQQDPYAGRRYSLPAHNVDQANSYSQDPSSDGYPPYQPPSSTAFASSTLSASNPTEFPSSYSSSQYQDRRPSYASDSLLFDSSTQAPTFSLSASIPSAAATSSYLPSSTGTDSFSAFNPYSAVPPTSGVAPSRLLERRASMAAANAPPRERVRSKPYDINERRSPTHSAATVDQ